MDVKIKRLTKTAKLPTYATDGSGGFDFYADISGSQHVDIDCPVTISTGLAVQIPEGYGLLLIGRSGHGFKFATRLANCVGLIDSDYRGEIKIRLQRDAIENIPMHIANGDRIAQGFIVEMPRVNWIEVDELDETARGEGGFGSTGYR
jgi:dUTP pyrophosphatase